MSDIETIKSKIEALEINSLEHREAISKNRKIVKELNYELAFKEHGIKIGSVVKIKGEEYKVDELTFWSNREPTPRGFKRKKNGDWGARSQRIYGTWEVVSNDQTTR